MTKTTKPIEQMYRDEDEGCWVSAGGSVEIVAKPEPKPEPGVEHYSVEASFLDWTNDQADNTVIYRGEVFEYVSTRRDFLSNEIISWKYRSANGNWLTVWKDQP